MRYPTALPSDERLLSLAELRSIGSVDEAERRIIVKEAEGVLRKRLDEQFECFSKRLKIDFGDMKELRGIASGEIDKAAMLSWPLFKQITNEIEFQKILRDNFN